MKQKARNLRKQQTDAEKKLWWELRNRQLAGYKFKRQYVLEKYIVEFYCAEKLLVIEVDGGQHAEQKEYDEKRTEFLISKGYKVIRFWNNEVMENLDGVLEMIMIELKGSPHPPA
jgi:very-short-patch-repair endonuclease